jgi:hypothetical protein
MAADTDQIVYTPEQARRVLAVGKTKFWAAVKSGEIPTFTWLGKTLVRAEDLTAARDRAFAKRPTAAAARPSRSARLHNSPPRRS